MPRHAHALTFHYDRFGSFAYAPGHEEHDVPEENYRMQSYVDWVCEKIAEIDRVSCMASTQT